jgi:undecaprenyl-diphosphatase
LLSKILQYDRELFLYLNSLGNEFWDYFWMSVTNKYYWFPLYGFILYLLFKNYGLKKTLFVLFILALLITFTDQFVNLIKITFQRVRPFKDESIQVIMRLVKKSGGYSFLSGHAANSFAVSTFIILGLKSHFKLIYMILIWPILFAYSRIYLGVHYPLDVLCGSILGIFLGFLFYYLFQYFWNKIFSRKIIEPQ